MNKNFYKQDESFAVDFLINRNGESFGLSGDNVLECFVANDLLFVNNEFVELTNKNYPALYSIYGKDNNVSIWKNGAPIHHPISSSFCFSSVYYDDQEPSVFISRPNVVAEFSGISNQTGYLVLSHNGKYNLEFTNLFLENSQFSSALTSGIIQSGQNFFAPLSLESFKEFSGISFINLETNAGIYALSGENYHNFVPVKNNIGVFVNKSFTKNSGVCDFFISNLGNQEETCSIEFNLVDCYGKSSHQGRTIYTSGSGAQTHYNSTSGFYKKLNGSGIFSTYFSGEITGFKEIEASYSGEISGVGGRLNGTGITDISGTGFVTIFSEGPITFNYNVPVSSYIGPYLAYSYLTGTLSGYVGPNSGRFLFQENIEGSVTSAEISGVTIYPSPLTMFSGKVNESVPLIQTVSSLKEFVVYGDVMAYEGQGDIFELFAIDYNDIDRGLENFYDLNRKTISGFGNSSQIYRIPTGVTTSGQIRYISDYEDSLLFDCFLYVKNPTTNLNRLLYITK